MKNPIKILIIEDSEDDVKLLLREIQKHSYEPNFKRVETPEEFTESLEQENWDVIICDYVLPKFSVSDALEIIKKREFDIPFIIVSGVVGEEVVIESLKKGAHDFINKNNLTRLVPAIERELESVEICKEKRKAEKELANEKERLAVTLESIGDGVIATDKKGKIVLMNKVAEELTGWTQEEAKDAPLSKVFNIINEINRTPCVNPIGKVLEKGIIIGLANNTVLISRDGTERILADAGAPIHDKNNNIFGVVLIFRDVTEKRRMEQMLIQSEKMASIGTLASGVAHEINNPMGYIFSNLKTLEGYNKKLRNFCGHIQSFFVDYSKKEGGNASILSEKFKKFKEENKVDFILEDMKSAIEESLEGAEKVKRIVSNLRDFSRIEKPIIEYANINEGIEKTLNIIWNELKYKATIVKEFGDIPSINCDIQKLNQVFINILVNAVQAIEKQGTIKIKTYSENNSVIVQISDTGKGIPQKDINKIFDAFYTTKEPSKGTGLGLAISYKIIKEHNGVIEVKSEVGKGTTFTIKLPINIS